MNISVIRSAGSDDWEAIAQLHTLSWQSAYRGILPEDFLLHNALPSRRDRWCRLLCPRTQDDMLVLMALAGENLGGFICIRLDSDPVWGALIDNLHIHPGMKGSGIGRALMVRGMAWIAEQRTKSPAHLWAFEANHPARAFYEHLGGKAVERKLQTSHGAFELPEIRYAWNSPFSLAPPDPGGSR